MKNIDLATPIVLDLAKLLISTMQAMNVPWTRAFVRFRMVEENHFGCNGSYETPTDVFLLSALKEGKNLFHEVNRLGPQLRDATSHDGKTCCVFLLIVDNKFNYSIKFEHDDPDRWKITKLNGSNGLPADL